jgi:quercetin dioxygenase-like cupin family protein
MQTRKLVAAILVALPLFGTAGTVIIRTGLAAERSQGRPASAQDTIGVTRNGSRASQRGPAENFTGAARIDPLFDPNDVANAGAAYVTFEPGARTAWHTHPRGQRLVVTAGVGRVQRWQGPLDEIRPGDVVWIPAGVRHWHGASPTTAMTHVAIQEALNGSVVTWLEKVSDRQYGVAPRPR